MDMEGIPTKVYSSQIQPGQAFRRACTGALVAIHKLE